MNRMQLAAVATIATLFTACGSSTDTGPQPVTIDFKALVGTQTFSCADTAGYAIGTGTLPWIPKDFRFYVSNVRLVDAAGAEAPVTLDASVWQGYGVALLDFENGTGNCTGGTVETNKSIQGTVAPGTYVGLKFDVGVPTASNHLNVDAATEEPDAGLDRVLRFAGREDRVFTDDGEDLVGGLVVALKEDDVEEPPVFPRVAVAGVTAGGRHHPAGVERRFPHTLAEHDSLGNRRLDQDLGDVGRRCRGGDRRGCQPDPCSPAPGCHRRLPPVRSLSAARPPPPVFSAEPPGCITIVPATMAVGESCTDLERATAALLRVAETGQAGLRASA